VDLDISKGSITLPGVVSAIPVERPYDIEEGFGFSQPIAYFYGDVLATQNPKFYTKQVQNLAAVIKKRNEFNKSASSSGIIVNTMGWVDGQGYLLLCEAIDAFEPDIILVIAHERLYSDLQNSISKLNPNIQIVKMPKSGGVVTRDAQTRRKAQSNRIKEYFYGRMGDLCPHSTLISFNNFRVFKTSVGPAVPMSVLPIGSQPQLDPMKIRETTPNSELKHSILGVSHSEDLDHLTDTNVAGFLYVTDLNLEKRTMTALAPYPGPLPGKLLLVGNLKYLE